MTALTYYPTRKRYTANTVSWDKSDSRELGEFQNGLGLTLEFADVAGIRNPVLLVCRDRGLLKLNSYTFFDVNIPEDLRPRLRCCSTIEVIVSYSPTSATSVYPEVERVLRMPPYLDAFLPSKSAGGKGKDKSADESNDVDHMDVTDNITVEVGEDTSADDGGEAVYWGAEKSEWERISPQKTFMSWLTDNDGEVLYEYKHKASEFIFVLVRHLPMLVSFFDGDDISWLADEEMFNDEPPLWFSQDSHQQSPLYAMGLALRHLRSRGCARVLPVTLMSDHIEIINAMDMKEEFDRIGISICYCTREDKYFPSFEQCLGLAPIVKKDLWTQDADDLKQVREALDEFDEEAEN